MKVGCDAGTDLCPQGSNSRCVSHYPVCVYMHNICVPKHIFVIVTTAVVIFAVFMRQVTVQQNCALMEYMTFAETGSGQLADTQRLGATGRQARDKYAPQLSVLWVSVLGQRDAATQNAHTHTHARKHSGTPSQHTCCLVLRHPLCVLCLVQFHIALI